MSEETDVALRLYALFCPGPVRLYCVSLLLSAWVRITDYVLNIEPNSFLQCFYLLSFIQPISVHDINISVQTVSLSNFRIDQHIPISNLRVKVPRPCNEQPETWSVFDGFWHDGMKIMVIFRKYLLKPKPTTEPIRTCIFILVTAYTTIQLSPKGTEYSYF